MPTETPMATVIASTTVLPTNSLAGISPVNCPSSQSTSAATSSPMPSSSTESMTTSEKPESRRRPA